MRALMLAGLVAVAGVATGAEVVKPPTLEEKIARTEAALKSGAEQLARLEAKIKSAKESGKAASMEERMADNIRRQMATGRANLTEWRREAAAANPKKAAEVRYAEAVENVAACKKMLEAAQAEMKEAAEAVRKAGGDIPDSEPK